MEKNSNLNLRLTKLEEFYLSLSTHLEGERVLRKEEDEKCKQLCDILARQIIEIKETQPNELFKTRFSSQKEQLLNIIESKIDEKIIENKEKIKSQYLNMKTNDDFLFKNIEKEFEHYKFELNNLNKKVEILEKSYNNKIKDLSVKIQEIDNSQNNLKIFNNDIMNKMNDISFKINQIQNQMLQEKKLDLVNKFKNIESKLEDMNLINKENEEKNNIDLNTINNNLDYLKQDFTSLSENFMKEFEEMNNNLNKQNILQNKEITNFEHHILGEHENFTKFITNILNQNIDKIKSMNEYLNSDVEIIKNKNQYLEETLLKLREDIYDTLKKNSKYILDKMNSLFNIQTDNNSSDKENNEKEIQEKI